MLVGIFTLTNMSAQESINYTDLSQAEVDKIVKSAWDVIKEFGPEYYRPGTSYTLSESIYESDGEYDCVSQNNGRKFLEILFPYDLHREMFEEWFLAAVFFWKDTKEPWKVTYGNGKSITFMKIPYKRMKLLKEHEIVPYQPDTVKMKKFKALRKETGLDY